MTHVDFSSDGNLTFTNYRHSSLDVSTLAIAHLFESVQLSDSLILRDVFLLLRKNPELLVVFGRFGAFELLEEAFASDPDIYDDQYDPEGIEYLELSRHCSFDSNAKTYSEMNRLELSGIGFVQRDCWVSESEVCAKGDRRSWDVSFMTPTQLLLYPLRFSPFTDIWSTPTPTSHADEERLKILDRVSYGRPTLGQVLHGVLWSLSFNGVGNTRSSREQELNDIGEGEFTESFPVFPDFLQTAQRT